MQTLTEPIIMGVIAMIAGRATAETIWPEYKPAGQNYPNVVVKSSLLTVDNYKQFLADLAKSAPFKT